MLFLTMTQFFKTTICPYAQPGVHSWFEEHEDALQHSPWPAQSPDLNIIEPLLPVLEQIPSSIKSQETKRRSA